jgi:hypothetical protein
MRADFEYPKLRSYNIYILAARSTIYRTARPNLVRDWLNTGYILYTTHLGNVYNLHNAGYYALKGSPKITTA